MIVLATGNGSIEGIEEKTNDPIANGMISITDIEDHSDGKMTATEATQKWWKQETQKVDQGAHYPLPHWNND